MALLSAITALSDLLRSKTGAAVFLGRPDSAAPGVYVWPWKVDESSSVKRTRPPFMSGPAQTGTAESELRPAPNVDVSFLILVEPALTPDGLTTLDAVRQVMHDNPVLTFADGTARLESSLLSRDDLTTLFLSASTPLTLCLSGMLQGITQSNDA